MHIPCMHAGHVATSKQLQRVRICSKAEGSVAQVQLLSSMTRYSRLQAAAHRAIGVSSAGL